MIRNYMMRSYYYLMNLSIHSIRMLQNPYHIHQLICQYWFCFLIIFQFRCIEDFWIFLEFFVTPNNIVDFVCIDVETDVAILVWIISETFKSLTHFLFLVVGFFISPQLGIDLSISKFNSLNYSLPYLS